MSAGLLDVNVLIALAWPTHVHHPAARKWFTANRAKGWATCPLTQIGFVRISSHRQFGDEPVSVTEALALLRSILAREFHVFWPDAVSLTDDNVPVSHLLGHGQLTDAYILGLALKNNGKLITFDRGIASLVPGRSGPLIEVIST